MQNISFLPAMLCYRKLVLRLMVMFMFSLLVFLVSAGVVKAQSCSGTVTCCYGFTLVDVPPGCSTSCGVGDSSCVRCTGTVSVCNQVEVQSCGWRSLPSGGMSCSVQNTCNWGSVGSCNVSSPAPTNPPPGQPPPTQPPQGACAYWCATKDQCKNSGGDRSGRELRWEYW